MKYIVILLLIIVLIFLFNIKEPWGNKINPIEGKLSEPDLTESDKIIDYILSKDEYTQKIKNNIINNYKQKFKNIDNISKSLEGVKNDINKQLKKVFIEDINRDKNLVDYLTTEIKKDTNLIKGELGDKGEIGALTSNPNEEVIAKSLNINANENINDNFIKKFDKTIQGNNPIISKSNIYLGDIKKNDVLKNALFTDNLFIGDKHIKSGNITDPINSNNISAINFGNELQLNKLKVGNHEIIENNNKLEFNDLISNNLDVNNLTVNNTTFEDIKEQGAKGETGDRGLSPTGGTIYKNPSLSGDTSVDGEGNPSLGKIDFNFSDGSTQTKDLYGSLKISGNTNKGDMGVDGEKGDIGIRGANLTSGSYNKTTDIFKFNGRTLQQDINFANGNPGLKGIKGIKGKTGYSISPVNSSVSNNTLKLVNNNKEEKQNITLPVLKGSNGEKGVQGNSGSDFESPLFNEIIPVYNTIEFNSDVKLNRNLCFKKSGQTDSEFCLNKKSFINKYAKIKRILNRLGVNKNIDVPQSEYILRLNAAKLGYKPDDELYDNNDYEIDNILDFFEEKELILDILNKLNIKLNDMSIDDALNKVENFRIILEIKPEVYDGDLINYDFFEALDQPEVKERKHLLEQILYIDNLYEIDITKPELNKKIKDFFCNSTIMKYKKNTYLCKPKLILNNFDDIKDRYKYHGLGVICSKDDDCQAGLKCARKGFTGDYGGCISKSGVPDSLAQSNQYAFYKCCSKPPTN